MTAHPVARLSLRWKLVVALMITSAATLAADDAVLVPSVERHLQGDQLAGLARVARIADLALGDLGRRDLRPRAPELMRVAERVAFAAHGRAALFGPSGRVLVTGGRAVAPEPPLPFVRWPLEGPRANHLVERVAGGQAVVASHIDSSAGELTLVVARSLREERSATAVVRRTLPRAAAIGLLVAAVLGVLFATRLLGRLRRLADGARGLDGDGMGSPLPPGAGRDEVGELSSVLEDMRARLWADQQARHAFVATASHELRTPLASLGASLELLDEGLNKPDPSLEAARRRVRAARDQADRLRSLAGDLLDMGQLDAGIPLRSESIGVAEIASVVAQEFESRGHVVTRCEGPALATGDPTAVARIMRTLLDNALTYGPPGGPVELTVTCEPPAVTVVRVTDQGAGVPPQERERIFGRFERGNGAGTGGFGLGLAIARELAERMDGTLRLLDEAPPTTFELRLPGVTSAQQELHEIAMQP